MYSINISFLHENWNIFFSFTAHIYIKKCWFPFMFGLKKKAYFVMNNYDFVGIAPFFSPNNNVYTSTSNDTAYSIRLETKFFFFINGKFDGHIQRLFSLWLRKKLIKIFLSVKYYTYYYYYYMLQWCYNIIMIPFQTKGLLCYTYFELY